VFPRERTGIPHLPATLTEWWLSSEIRAFTGSSPEVPNSVPVTFSRSRKGRGLWTFETRCNRARNGRGTLPVGHTYGVAILSKTLNLVVEISNDYKIL
jgi:hypothetical protein